MIEYWNKYIRSSRICSFLCCQKKFIFFCCIGLINTLIDFSLYIVLTRCTDLFAHYFLFAHCIGFFVASTNSFFMNRRWTFNVGPTALHRQYIRYLIANIIGLCANSIVLYLLITQFHLFDIYAKGVTVIVFAFIMYYVHKEWTFRKEATS